MTAQAHTRTVGRTEVVVLLKEMKEKGGGLFPTLTCLLMCHAHVGA